MSMDTYTWRAFFSCNDLTKPVMHFFPHSSGSTAPYAVNCTLTIFGGGVVPRSLTLEGARINQPDGIRLDAVFQELLQVSQGFIGLDVTLQSVQRRLDLSSSQIIIELVKGKQSLRYFATRVGVETEPKAQVFPVLASSDAGTTIVAINGSAEKSRVGYQQSKHSQTLGNSAMLAISPSEQLLDGLSIIELGAEQSVADTAQPIRTFTDQQSDNFGIKPIAPGVYSSIRENDAVAYYSLVRDLNTKAPISVHSL